METNTAHPRLLSVVPIDLSEILKEIETESVSNQQRD